MASMRVGAPVAALAAKSIPAAARTPNSSVRYQLARWTAGSQSMALTIQAPWVESKRAP